MPFTVWLTDGAARDLEDLHRHIGVRDSPDKADHVLQSIERQFGALSGTPLRGAYPPELLALGIKEYREVHFKPYRIVYRVSDGAVHVLMIADGRRDMEALLQRRLLEA